MSSSDKKRHIQENPEQSTERESLGGRTRAEIFAEYYALGFDRTLLELSKRTGVSFDILNVLADTDAWDERVDSLDKDIQKKYEASYRDAARSIRNRLVDKMQQLLSDMDNCSLGLPFAVTGPEDLRKIAQAYESLVRANNMALQASVGPSGSKDQPKTWSELLESSTTENDPRET